MPKMKRILGLLLAIHLITVSLVVVCTAAKPDFTTLSDDAAKAHYIESLPGYGKINHFDLYGGTIPVSSDQGRQLYDMLAESSRDPTVSSDRQLYYMLAESSRDPDTDPLVLWLNGGPGCSSIGGGFLSELGPFYPPKANDYSARGDDAEEDPSHRLIVNPFAWNRVANVVFLESPAFVGFSYSNNSDDAVVGDKRTAEDSLQFLLNFMELHPRYKGRKLWLSGESYAGHYLPQLAQQIIHYNKRPEFATDSESPLSNFQGYLLGNAWTDTATENQGAVDFWYSHGIISDDTKRGIDDYCDYSTVGPLAIHRHHLYMVSINSVFFLLYITGNPLTDPSIDSRGALEFWFTHGIISSKTYDGILDACDFTSIGPLMMTTTMQERLNSSSNRAVNQTASSRKLLASSSSNSSSRLVISNTSEELAKHRRRKCEGYLAQSTEEFGGINIYDIYADVCLPQAEAVIRQLTNQLSKTAAPHPVPPTPPPPTPKYDPCVDDQVTIYLNRPDVQQAIHANITGTLPGPWQTCTPRIDYSRDDILTSVLDIYDELLDANLKLLVYSGDVDAIVPIISTRRWITSLNLQVISPWRPWRSSTEQVAGWTEGYSNGLTFASVREGGHMVPYTQPERAFHLFSRFIHGEQL